MFLSGTADVVAAGVGGGTDGDAVSRNLCYWYTKRAVRDMPSFAAERDNGRVALRLRCVSIGGGQFWQGLSPLRLRDGCGYVMCLCASDGGVHQAGALSVVLGDVGVSFG